MATKTSAGVLSYQLADLHGDVVAEASSSPTATTQTWTGAYDEFGLPQTASARRYGWLGANQRSQELPGGVVQMEARLYLPQAGRFLQIDPVDGGSANAYDYVDQDPLSSYDFDGLKKCRRNRYHKCIKKDDGGGSKAGIACLEDGAVRAISGAIGGVVGGLAGCATGALGTTRWMSPAVGGRVRSTRPRRPSSPSWPKAPPDGWNRDRSLLCRRRPAASSRAAISGQDHRSACRRRCWRGVLIIRSSTR